MSTYALAQLVAAAVDEANGVVRRDGGARGAVATFGSSAPVEGVRVNRSGGRLERVRVDIVVRYGVPIADVAGEVRRRVAASLGEFVEGSKLAIDVNVSDIVQVDDDPAALGPARSGGG